MQTERWTVEIYLSESEGHTHARAVLTTRDHVKTEGKGTAHRNPADPDVTEIGDELAAGRALVNLGKKLLRIADQDIADMTHEQHAAHGREPGGWPEA